jgi:hypothetical protein
MNTHERRWPRPQRAAREQLSQEQLAAAFAEALEWRKRWRAELEATEDDLDRRQASRPAPDRSNQDARARARFAAAVARAELKRFYWDGRREAEFQQARKGRSRPANGKGTRPR